MLPVQYKASAEGLWTNWDKGTIEKDILLSAGHGYAPYKINGVIVYSFKFSDGSIWNINDGWIK